MEIGDIVEYIDISTNVFKTHSIYTVTRVCGRKIEVKEISGKFTASRFRHTTINVRIKHLEGEK